MKVCIGITTKNRADILSKSIEAALGQSYSNKEVVVFDDGSNDHTKSVIENYPNIRKMGATESLGLLGARNALMRSTDAELYVTLDDDAWFLKGDEIEVAASHMIRNPKLGAIAFDVLQRNTGRFNTIDRTEPVPTNLFIGCGAMLRLSAVREAGDFVPFPVKYGHEEKDLSIRMIDCGYTLIFLPGVHIWHDYTALERNLSDQRNSFIINDLIYQYRRVPNIYLVPVLANNILRKLRSSDDAKGFARESIKSFFKLIPTQKSYIQRVRPSSYRFYRRLSVNFLNYLNQTNQTGEKVKRILSE